MKSFKEFLDDIGDEYLGTIGEAIGTTRRDALKRAMQMHGRKQHLKIAAHAGGSKAKYYGVHAALPLAAATAGGAAMGHPMLGPAVAAAAVAPAVGAHAHQLWKEYKQVRAKQAAVKASAKKVG